MVTAGSVEITGELKSGGINQGLNRINADFKKVENQSNQTNVSLARASRTASMLGKTLVGIGVAGAAAFTAVATKSPVLAGTFAKMDIQMLKLSNIAGRQMKPLFETIANEVIPSIGLAIERFGPQIETMLSVISKGLVLVSKIPDPNPPIPTPEQIVVENNGQEVVRYKPAVENFSTKKAEWWYNAEQWWQGLNEGLMGMLPVLNSYIIKKEDRVSFADGVVRGPT